MCSSYKYNPEEHGFGKEEHNFENIYDDPNLYNNNFDRVKKSAGKGRRLLSIESEEKEENTKNNSKEENSAEENSIQSLQVKILDQENSSENKINNFRIKLSLDENLNRR